MTAAPSDAQFITDAGSGRLPAFSVVLPGRDGESEHNGFSMTKGDNFGQSPLSAVRMRHRPVPKGDHIRWSQAKRDT